MEFQYDFVSDQWDGALAGYWVIDGETSEEARPSSEAQPEPLPALLRRQAE